jgi:Reverse transcriptase (RNA-dependent DNA polymerase)
MPFGLVNAPATFQRAMDVMLSSVKWKFCLMYLDDIIIYSSSHEQHLKDLNLVLELINRAGLTLSLKKCRFFKEKVNFLAMSYCRENFELIKAKLILLGTRIFLEQKRNSEAFLVYATSTEGSFPNSKRKLPHSQSYFEEMFRNRILLTINKKMHFLS